MNDFCLLHIALVYLAVINVVTFEQAVMPTIPTPYRTCCLVTSFVTVTKIFLVMAAEIKRGKGEER